MGKCQELDHGLVHSRRELSFIVIAIGTEHNPLLQFVTDVCCIYRHTGVGAIEQVHGGYLSEPWLALEHAMIRDNPDMANSLIRLRAETSLEVFYRMTTPPRRRVESPWTAGQRAEQFLPELLGWPHVASRRIHPAIGLYCFAPAHFRSQPCYWSNRLTLKYIQCGGMTADFIEGKFMSYIVVLLI